MIEGDDMTEIVKWPASGTAGPGDCSPTWFHRLADFSMVRTELARPRVVATAYRAMRNEREIQVALALLKAECVGHV